jgi:monoamine oxidase
MVEGYDAADVTRISARAVLEEWSGPASVSARTFRPARGYDTLVESIRSTLASEGAAQHFGTIVRSIAWKKGHVTVEAESDGERTRFEARRAIITLPIGVLQLPGASPNAVRFTPELVTKRRSLEYLASGPVIKVVMSFARPFWTELDDGRYRDAAFFFVPQAPFPTFWTTLPLRSSLLVAWCGGSNVARLSASSGDEVIEAVRISLRALFGRRNYSSLLEHVAWHDWQRDPSSCGAYSYVLARGSAARRSLSEPVEGTLFFAGEACDNTGEAATVGGALRSGIRAARQVLEDS